MGLFASWDPTVLQRQSRGSQWQGALGLDAALLLGQMRTALSPNGAHMGLKTQSAELTSSLRSALLPAPRALEPRAVLLGVGGGGGEEPELSAHTRTHSHTAADCSCPAAPLPCRLTAETPALPPAPPQHPHPTPHPITVDTVP